MFPRGGAQAHGEPGYLSAYAYPFTSAYTYPYTSAYASAYTQPYTHLAVVLLSSSFRYAISGRYTHTHTHTHTYTHTPHTQAVGQMVPSFREKVGGDPFIAVVAYKGSPPPGWMMQVCWVGGVGGWVGRSVTTFV